MTVTLLETVPESVPLLKLMVIFVATLCERLVKVTRPAVAVKLVTPCKIPLPALRLALTTVVLSLVRKFPNWSWT